MLGAPTTGRRSAEKRSRANEEDPRFFLDSPAERRAQAAPEEYTPSSVTVPTPFGALGSGSACTQPRHHSRKHSLVNRPPLRVDVALLTAAHRAPASGVIEPAPLKELALVRGKPLIVRVIETLVSAGIRRLVIVIAEPHADDITRVVCASGACERLESADFVRLAAVRCHAACIAAARQRLPPTFLLMSGDQLFSRELIARVANAPIDAAAACVAVETHLPARLDTLPKSAVLVEVAAEPANSDELMPIAHIGRRASVPMPTGIGTGLMLLTQLVVDAIIDFSCVQTYVSLAQVLQLFAARGELRSVPTRGVQPLASACAQALQMGGAGASRGPLVSKSALQQRERVPQPVELMPGTPLSKSVEQWPRQHAPSAGEPAAFLVHPLDSTTARPSLGANEPRNPHRGLGSADQALSLARSKGGRSLVPSDATVWSKVNRYASANHRTSRGRCRCGSNSMHTCSPFHGSTRLATQSTSDTSSTLSSCQSNASSSRIVTPHECLLLQRGCPDDRQIRLAALPDGEVASTPSKMDEERRATRRHNPAEGFLRAIGWPWLFGLPASHEHYPTVE